MGQSFESHKQQTVARAPKLERRTQNGLGTAHHTNNQSNYVSTKANRAPTSGRRWVSDEVHVTHKHSSSRGLKFKPIKAKIKINRQLDDTSGVELICTSL
ncbi:unnamed protein product [Clavelina lepadiformis]|uniref:Uncharacterized protein n=1 Tax=Clavelina lepadiformis TaxID=159417 RepID=A0ABP0FIT5_CLALP